MTRKVKVGAFVVGSFVALIGGMYGVKMLTGTSPSPQLAAQNPSKEMALPKGNTGELLEKSQKSNTAESPLSKSMGDNNDSKLKIQPVTLTLDPDPKNKEATSPSLSGLPSLESVSLVPPEKKPEPVQLEVPKTLPNSLVLDENVKQVQNLDLNSNPMNNQKKEEKSDPLGLPSLEEIGKSNPTKKEVQPVGLNSNEKETPKATGLELKLDLNQNKEKEKPITISDINLTESKTNPMNSPKKEEKSDPLGLPALENTPIKRENENSPLKLQETPMKKEKENQTDPLKLEPTNIKIEIPPKKEIESPLLKEELHKQPNPETKLNKPESEPKIQPTEIRNPENNLDFLPKQENKEITTIKIESPTTNKTPVDLEKNIYDEDLYRLTANDRATPDLFRRLSEKYYQEVDYYGALTLYNRENPAGNGSIRIPPIEVLEKRYPNYIGKTSHRAIQMTSGSSPSIPNESPPQAFKNPLENFPVYTVGGNGETLREIAERKLGNPAYWKNIKDLNVSLNENERIPAGTKLYLPPQAQTRGE